MVVVVEALAVVVAAVFADMMALDVGFHTQIGKGYDVTIPLQVPGTRLPSLHVVGVHPRKLALRVFVQDPPEGSAAVQSPTVSALESSSDASQCAKKQAPHV